MTDGGTFLLVLRMLVSLAIVLGLVVLFARWLERRGVGGGVARPRRRGVAGGGARTTVEPRAGGDDAPDADPPGRAARRRAGRGRTVTLPRWRPTPRPGPLVTAEVVARAPLSRTASVQVVRVGGRFLALGVTDHAVAVLTELGPADLEGEDEPATPAAHPAARPGVEAAAAQARAADASAVEIFETMLDREGRHRVGPDARHDEPRG